MSTVINLGYTILKKSLKILKILTKLDIRKLRKWNARNWNHIFDEKKL